MIHDGARDGLWMRRVEYDVESASRAVLDAGFPAKLAERLHKGE
jgi:hypothetical protein